MRMLCKNACSDRTEGKEKSEMSEKAEAGRQREVRMAKARASLRSKLRTQSSSVRMTFTLSELLSTCVGLTI